MELGWMMILIVSSIAEMLMRATAFSVPEIICQQTLSANYVQGITTSAVSKHWTKPLFWGSSWSIGKGDKYINRQLLSGIIPKLINTFKNTGLVK